MFRKLTFVLSMLLLAAFVVPTFAQDAATVTVAPDGKVVLGLAAALSGEGLAPFGEDIQRGAELALEDRPTVKVGDKEFPVELDVQDDLCSAEGGQAVANLFVSDASVVGVVGPMCSSACTAAAPIFDEAGYSSISPSCTAANLSQQDFTSFNRAVVSDGFQGKVAAQYIYDNLGVKKIATIHDGSAYGEGLVAEVTKRFEELGGEVVAADAVNVGDTDFRSLLEDIASKSPELIYFGGFAAEGARLAQQRADAGLGDAIFMGADGIKGGEFPTLAGDAKEGVYTSSSIPTVTDQAKVDALLARYKEKYGVDPTGPFQVNAYDATNMFLDAIEAVGTVDADGNLVIDRAALAEYIRSIKDFKGLSGDLNCDGTGECSSADIGIAQYKGEDVVQVAVGKPNADGTISIVMPDATPEATPSS
jgi:branched-chain amino acid transport system substrate-binding protein